LIEQKAEGHPLFVEELVSSLVDRELIAVRGGDCLILGDRARLSSTAISDTVQGIITSRVDQLSPSQQLTLKVASVLGRQFAVADLAAIHPLRPTETELAEQLGVMEGLELVRTTQSLGEVAFHHATIEEVAYALLPLAQRRELHAATAGRYEIGVAGQSPRSLALLAHHWTQAGVIAKALEALDRAGEQALRAGAFPEAVLFLKQALGLAQNLKGDVSGTRLARWERQLSRAYFGMGDAGECRRHGESAVARLDRAVPRGPIHLAAAIVRELLKSLSKLLSDSGGGNAPTDGNRRHLTRAFHALSYAYYLDQERASLLHAVLVTVNNAAGDLPTGELARGYAALGYMAGAYGFGRLSGLLQERALRVAGKLDRPLVRADVLYILGLSRMSNGQWEALRSDMVTARALFEGLGEIRSLLDVQLLENYVSYNTGELERAARAYTDVRAAASRVGAGRNEYLAATWEAGTALRRGRFDECLSAVRRATALSPERGAELSLLGFSSLGSLRTGDSAAARKTAEEAGALMAAHEYTAPYSFEGYRDIADVYLTLWETAGQTTGETDSLRRAARAICDRLRLFSHGCAIAKPSALWIRGRYDALLDRRRRAVRQWSRALDLAVAMNLPFEEAMVRRELARFGRDSALRRSHLLAARALLERIGARYELSRLEAP
jgi:tetratricopeptide (TPR) repeat protein